MEGVSLRWLLGFVVDLYHRLPDDLNLQVKAEAEELILYTFESEIDEMLSFVGKKANKQWIWTALDVNSRQIIAFHVEAEMVRVLKLCGSPYPRATGSTPRSIPMAGVRMRGSFQTINIGSSINNGVSPITSSDSTVP